MIQLSVGRVGQNDAHVPMPTIHAFLFIISFPKERGCTTKLLLCASKSLGELNGETTLIDCHRSPVPGMCPCCCSCQEAYGDTDKDTKLHHPLP